MRYLLFTLFFVVLHSFVSFAQSDLYGVWTNFAVKKTWNDDWNTVIDAEFRTYDYIDQFDKFRMGAHVNYTLAPALNFGFGYNFFRTYDKPYDNFQMQHRLQLQTNYSLKMNRFTLSVRERIQSLIRDNSNRFDLSNPSVIQVFTSKWTWRNMLQLSYDIPKYTLTPSVSAESFYDLNVSPNLPFQLIRYKFAIKKKLSKSHAVQLYHIINSNPTGPNHQGKYILGAAYHFDF